MQGYIAGIHTMVVILTRRALYCVEGLFGDNFLSVTEAMLKAEMLASSKIPQVRGNISGTAGFDAAGWMSVE